MPSTWKVLQEKITAAENAVNTSGATQEVYNQCAAEPTQGNEWTEADCR